jgi:rfaE bifunctional protein kinase chain/domain
MSDVQQPLVLISGQFNVLHPGHLRLMQFAKAYGGRLVVAVMSDRIAGKGAHVPQDLRLIGVQSNTLIDEAFIADEEINSVILRLRPDIVVKGKEHEIKFNPEHEALSSYGGRLVFSSGESIFSTRDLIRREFREADYRTIKYPEDFARRHNIDVHKLKTGLEKLAKLRVLVIGDVIVDEYITCQPLGMSQEDPTLVVTPVDSIKFIGGAGIVAAHAAGLGAAVTLISVTGKDASQTFVSNGLGGYHVTTALYEDATRPTTLKQRYRAKGKTLLRVSHLHESAISIHLQAEIFSKFETIIKEIDLVVFSDFNYGCLPTELVNRMIALARKHNIYIAADSQSSSQVGDIGRFKDVNLITPTEREARLSMRNREDGLVVLAEELMKSMRVENVLLKMGEEGLLVHTHTPVEWMTDRIEALNAQPKDVSGAGDSLLITSAMALASGSDIWVAACLGSIAAAIQVGRIGNTPLTLTELMSNIR